MNTEHTNQSRQAANAAFEQWWQRHGLEDPMDDEDRYYITASSWARRGYLAAMQAQQAEDTDAEWRRLALQFDGHRMQALAHLRCLLENHEGHADAVRAFLAAPPLSGEQVLNERIAAMYQSTDDWQPSGIEYDRSIHGNPDAGAWAKFFVETFPALKGKEGLMLGWFANAMMAMHDYLHTQPPAVGVPTIKLGIYGKAFDSPQTRRAYTYREQPDNIGAYKLGRAVLRAASGGDSIDYGLSLLKHLQAEGFGVFELGDQQKGGAA